jgi:hypothetical protein
MFIAYGFVDIAPPQVGTFLSQVSFPFPWPSKADRHFDEKSKLLRQAGDWVMIDLGEEGFSSRSIAILKLLLVDNDEGAVDFLALKPLIASTGSFLFVSDADDRRTHLYLLKLCEDSLKEILADGTLFLILQCFVCS